MVRQFLQSFSPLRMKWVWKWIFFGILIGVVSGFGAILFNFLLQKGTQFFQQNLIGLLLPKGFEKISFLNVSLTRWMILWIPALGGLLSGLIVFRFAPETEGAGVNAVIESFHQGKGLMRKRVPFVKLIASAITIGSGGGCRQAGSHCPDWFRICFYIISLS
jgi:CIC family chloride channel protein